MPKRAQVDAAGIACMLACIMAVSAVMSIPPGGGGSIDLVHAQEAGNDTIPVDVPPVVPEDVPVEPEPVQDTEPEPIEDPEPVQDPDPVKEPEPVQEPEPVKDPEPVQDTEPEPIEDPEPVQEPEPVNNGTATDLLEPGIYEGDGEIILKPVKEPEPVEDPEPVKEPEPVEEPEPARDLDVDIDRGVIHNDTIILQPEPVKDPEPVKEPEPVEEPEPKPKLGPQKDPRVLDVDGEQITTGDIRKEIQIVADLDDREGTKFDYTVTVLRDDKVAFKTGRSGTIPEIGRFSPVVKWEPEIVGTYDINIVAKDDSGRNIIKPATIKFTAADPAYENKPVNERFVISNPFAAGDSKETPESISVDDRVSIAADLKNIHNQEQEFIYIVTLDGPDGQVGEPKTISGSIFPGKTFSPAVSYVPDVHGDYKATIEVRPSIDSPDTLADPVDVLFHVKCGFIPEPEDNRVYNLWITDICITDTTGNSITGIREGERVTVHTTFKNGGGVTDFLQGVIKGSERPGEGDKFNHKTRTITGPTATFQTDMNFPDRGLYTITAYALSPDEKRNLAEQVKIHVPVGDILSMSEPAVTEANGATLGSLVPGKQVRMAVDFENKYDRQLEFSYTARMTSPGGGIENWGARIILDPGRPITMEDYWTPDTAGKHTLEILARPVSGLGYMAETNTTNIIVGGDGLDKSGNVVRTVGGRPGAQMPMSITDSRASDSNNNRLVDIDVGDHVQLTTEFMNNRDKFQKFTYVAEIEKGGAVDENYLTTQMGPKTSVSSGMLWIPKAEGIYKITIHARPSQDSTVDLAVPVTYNVRVGDILPATEKITIEDPSIEGEARTGQKAEITSRITNHQDVDQRHVYIIRVVDEDDTVVHISWAIEDVGAGGSADPAISWTPGGPGTYEITTFVWTSLTDTPDALASPATSTVKVDDVG